MKRMARHRCIEMGRATVALLVAWAFGSLGCDFAGGTDGWKKEGRVYDEQENLGRMQESVQSGWQEHGQGTGGFAAMPTWSATLISKSTALEDDPGLPGTPPEDPDDPTTPPGGEAPVAQTVWSYVLQYGNVILSPSGEALLAMIPAPGPGAGFAEPGLVLAAQAIPTGAARLYPQVRNVQRVNFSPDGQWAYLLSTDGTTVSRLDLSNYRITGVHHLDGAYSVLDVSPDGHWLVTSNLPRSVAEEKGYPDRHGCTPPSSLGLPAGSDLCQVGIVAIESGQSWSVTVSQPVRDVDFAVQSSELIITHKAVDDALEGNHAVIQFYDLKAQEAGARLVFPNCADELNVLPGEQVALLSPTYCASVDAADPKGGWNWLDGEDPVAPPPRSHEPISFLDLKTHTFIENLPGFGPIAVTADGKKALGFTRDRLLEEQWNYYGQSTPYGLVVVDVPSRTWQVYDYGDSIPSYFLSPDNKHAVVHNYFHRCECEEILPWNPNKTGPCIGSDYLACRDTCCADCCEESTQSNLYWFTLGTGEYRRIDIPFEPLQDFAWSPTGDVLFLKFESGLYRVQHLSMAPLKVALNWPPDLLGMRPQGDYLILGQRQQPTFVLYDLDGLVETLLVNLNLMAAHIADAVEIPNVAAASEGELSSYEFTLVRISAGPGVEDLKSCSAAPGPDIDAVVVGLSQGGGFYEDHPASQVVWLSEDVDCPQAGSGDAQEALGQPDAQSHDHGLESGHLSLNGRQLVLSFGVAFGTGDIIDLHEVVLEGEGSSDLSESLDLELGRVDSETGKTEWYTVATSISGFARIHVQ